MFRLPDLSNNEIEIGKPHRYLNTTTPLDDTISFAFVSAIALPSGVLFELSIPPITSIYTQSQISSDNGRNVVNCVGRLWSIFKERNGRVRGHNFSIAILNLG